MAFSLNRAELIGKLGSEPELKSFGDSALVKLNIATNESYKKKDGTYENKTEWHDVTFWGKPAEAIAKAFKKGDMIYVSGKIVTNAFKNKDGVDVRKKEITGDNYVQLSNSPKEAGKTPSSIQKDIEEEDEIPF